MNVIDPGHTYKLDSGTVVDFIKRENGELVHEGTTNEELLQVLLDRTRFLNDKFPCKENEEAIAHMKKALDWFNARTANRVKQGVETQDKQHVTEIEPEEVTASDYANRVKELGSVTAISASKGNYDYNQYMWGMANGLILAECIMLGNTDPNYLERPSEFLEDAPAKDGVVSNSMSTRIAYFRDTELGLAAEALKKSVPSLQALVNEEDE